MDWTVATHAPQVRSRMPAHAAAFQGLESLGWKMTMGNASGGRLSTTITIAAVRKYQGRGLAAGRGGRFDSSRNSPQCLHLTASSWISSAQYGHFFMFGSGRCLRKQWPALYDSRGPWNASKSTPDFFRKKGEAFSGSTPAHSRPLSISVRSFTTSTSVSSVQRISPVGEMMTVRGRAPVQSGAIASASLSGLPSAQM